MKFLIVQLLLVIAISGVHCRFSFFGRARNFEKLPNHKNYTLMSRYIVHNADWTAVAYTSYDKDTLNTTQALVLSYADGPLSNGTGVPYFYFTELEPGIKDIMNKNSFVGLVMTLAQTDVCVKNKWDTEDPRCARVFLNGQMVKLNNKTAEYDFAKKAFIARHPLFGGMPGFHNFYYSKYIIKTVKLISGFGGVRNIPLKDYFACKDSKYNLM